MGSSLDWSRYAYTMDEPRYLAVMEAFVRMHKAGLIYRGDRIVNWDPKMQTTVSDEEVERVEQKTPFYYFKYGPFTIGTVRPETKFGDKYVVMHPNDDRYKEYSHGQQLNLEWINGPITATVIKDEAIDMEVGSGVMTITPAHSGIDFEIAKKHGLDSEQVIDEKGILLPIAGEFAGVHIKKARPAIVEKLKSKGLLVKTDNNYVNTVATNSRGGGIIEPQIKRQWFVAVNKPFVIEDSKIPGIASGSSLTLRELMRKAVEAGGIKIMPDNFEKVYYHWIDNLHDWCISRQIWFGHRIPVWYRDQEVYCGTETPEGAGWEQDSDTLDTWFSSGLWTFSTLGWPSFAETATEGRPGPENDLANYHPTAVLETGYDILFFWVARMILMSGFHLGEVPFKTVYLHGLVRDGKGQKMSKSLGNIIDPVEMIDKYGADALRLSLIIGNTPGMDLKLSEDRIRGYKNFANKIWNIARFVLENTEGRTPEKPESISPAGEETLKIFKTTLSEVTGDIEEYRLYMAAEKLYHFVWHEFADKIIEESKKILRGEDIEAKSEIKYILYTILSDCLMTLHPFMPFVTEEIYSSLPGNKNLLMVSPWPHKE